MCINACSPEPVYVLQTYTTVSTVRFDIYDYMGQVKQLWTLEHISIVKYVILFQQLLKFQLVKI
jgi:hypothetical protein